MRPSHSTPNREISNYSERFSEKSLGVLLGELAGHSAILVRDEVALARQEVREKARTLRTPFILLAISAAGLLAGLLCFCAAASLYLSFYLALWQAALLVGLALTLCASALVAFSLKQLQQTNLKPEQTLETLEENKAWLKEIA